MTTEGKNGAGPAVRQSPNFPFDEWSQSLQDSTNLISITDQAAAEKFRPVHTTPSTVLLILLTLCLECSLFVVPYYCDDGSSSICGVPPYSIIMYCHASLWFLYMVIDRFWRYEHYKSRTRGYLQFYRHTRHVRRIPILIYSGGNAVLLVVSTVLANHCTSPTSDVCPGIPLTRSNYAHILVSIEVAAILPCLVLYLVRCVRFNRAALAPDIQEEELVGSMTTTRSLGNGVGFRDDSFVEDVLERQADMIRYLKHHNTHLGRKIVQLSAQLEHNVTS